MCVKLFCWFVGHKTMVKAFTGKSIAMHDRLNGGDINVAGYVWKREKYCVRCGTEVWK